MKRFIWLWVWFLVLLLSFGCAGLQKKTPEDEELERYRRAARETGAKWSTYSDFGAGNVDKTNDTLLLYDADDAEAAKINQYKVGDLGTDLRNMDRDIWYSLAISAAAFIADGTNCSDATTEQVNSGPELHFVNCSDAAGTIQIALPMPENWDGGNVYVELTGYTDQASPANTVEYDCKVQARGDSETINNTWTSTSACDFNLATGYVQYDLAIAESAVIAPSGAGGDLLFVHCARDNADSSTQDFNLAGMKVYYQVDDMDDRD